MRQLCVVDKMCDLKSSMSEESNIEIDQLNLASMDFIRIIEYSVSDQCDHYMIVSRCGDFPHSAVRAGKVQFSYGHSDIAKCI